MRFLPFVIVPLVHLVNNVQLSKNHTYHSEEIFEHASLICVYVVIYTLYTCIATLLI